MKEKRPWLLCPVVWWTVEATCLHAKKGGRGSTEWWGWWNKGTDNVSTSLRFPQTSSELISKSTGKVIGPSTTSKYSFMGLKLDFIQLMCLRTKDSAGKVQDWGWGKGFRTPYWCIWCPFINAVASGSLKLLKTETHKNFLVPLPSDFTLHWGFESKPQQRGNQKNDL